MLYPHVNLEREAVVRLFVIPPRSMDVLKYHIWDIRRMRKLKCSKSFEGSWNDVPLHLSKCWLLRVYTHISERIKFRCKVVCYRTVLFSFTSEYRVLTDRASKGTIEL